MALQPNPQGLRGNSNAVRDLVRKHVQGMVDQHYGDQGGLDGLMKDLKSYQGGDRNYQRYGSQYPRSKVIQGFMDSPFGEFETHKQREFLNSLGLRNPSGKEFRDDEVGQRYKYYFANELDKMLGEHESSKPVQFGNDLRPIK